MVARTAKQNPRLSHHAGQLLTARDLQDDVNYDARMRGLHVRALHGVWGIALGYEVLTATNPRFLVVTQGMAYDCAGREIVMSETLQVELPPPPLNSIATAWWFDLLIRHDPELGSGLSSNTCPGVSSSAWQERPAWRWSYAGDSPTPFTRAPGFADDVRLGEEIPLARVRVTDKGTWTDLELTVRRVARSLTRPHIAAGQVRAGSIEIQGSPLRWIVRIDTSSGGFNTFKPFYFITMSEHPLLSPTSGFAEATNPLTYAQRAQLLGPFARITSSSSTGFILDVRTAPVSAALLDAMPIAMQRTTGFRLPVAVNWVGVEPSGGCSPPRTSPRLLISSYTKISLLKV